LREIFVKYSSVSLSHTLNINEKVKYYIRKKIHKPNVLRFWVEGDVIPLCEFDSVLILMRSFQYCLLGLPNKMKKEFFNLACSNQEAKNMLKIILKSPFFFVKSSFF